jgi:hypothetical protein
MSASVNADEEAAVRRRGGLGTPPSLHVGRRPAAMAGVASRAEGTTRAARWLVHLRSDAV